MNVGIMQPNYLPWLGYFDMVACSHLFVLYDNVQFDKHGWRNRNRLLARPTPLWITAPVVTSGRHGQLVRDTVLADGPWQQKHLKTIRHIYAKAPYFDWLFPELESYLTRCKYTNLVDLNLEGHQMFTRLLAIDTPIRFSSELGKDLMALERTERLVTICRGVGATRYISASASRAYMIEELWQAAGIELRYQDYQHPTYAQPGGEFVSHLSAVDALMFEGPAARRFVGISVPK
jgi:hypothetical protein